MTALEFGYNIKRNSNWLRPYAIQLTRDPDDAKDLVQETVLKALTNREKFTDGTNLKAWLCTIMKNTFITHYKRMMKRNTFIDRSDNLHRINNGRFTESLAYTGFALNDIGKAIDSLADLYKRPFTLYFTGYKYHEIAEMLDIPMGTVKNRIHIARNLLKESLKWYSPG